MEFSLVSKGAPFGRMWDMITRSSGSWRRILNPPGYEKQTQGSGDFTCQLDVIDSFTNDLVNKKVRVFTDIRDAMASKKPASQTTSLAQTVDLLAISVKSDIQRLRSSNLGLDIRSLSRPQLDNLLLSTIETKNKLDFLYLISQCIEWQLLPSNKVLVPCLKYLSSISHIREIECFGDICRMQREWIMQTYADLSPFKAIALWKIGNTEAALETLRTGYQHTAAKKSEEGRKLIRAAFRTFSEETLTKKSEAILVSLISMASAIYAEHKDVFLLACIWKQCFASDWFSDQKTATELFDTYPELRQLVGRRSTSLCSSYLERNNVDTVYRLIEAFLLHKQKDACSNCLSLLFNYQYQRRDLRACAEIIKSCSDLEMPLTEEQNEQFLGLFLAGSEVPPKKPSRKSSQEFKYKF